MTRIFLNVWHFARCVQNLALFLNLDHNSVPNAGQNQSKLNQNCNLNFGQSQKGFIGQQLVLEFVVLALFPN